MTTAFVLSGGGSLGAIQVGMLMALGERGIAPDLLVGTSAGALNAAWAAGRGMSTDSLAGLAETWTGLRRGAVFPVEPIRHLLAVAGRARSLCSNASLRRLLSDHLTFARLEDAPLPLHVVATNLLSGQEVLLSSGPTVEAVLASAAIPAVFPPVEMGDQVLVDGGVADNAAISQAVALGADRVFVLPAGYACDLEQAPANALATALQALTLMIQQRLILEVRSFESKVEVIVLPPLCPLSVPSTDFAHAATLIRRAYRSSIDWLESGGPARPDQARFLSLHDHRPPATIDDRPPGRLGPQPG